MNWNNLIAGIIAGFIAFIVNLIVQFILRRTADFWVALGTAIGMLVVFAIITSRYDRPGLR
ncbi:MAG: hypothetical protein AB1467_00995 [Candidatus Diapherotrites archaeon]